MGLNALVTRDVAGLVWSLALQGEWKEHDLEEFSAVGRVPDDAMMLNIAVRAAVDRCTGLESFKSAVSTPAWQTCQNYIACVFASHPIALLGRLLFSQGCAISGL